MIVRVAAKLLPHVHFLELYSWDSVELTVRLANPPAGLVAKYTRKEREFFFDYAQYALRLFENPQIQQQLNSLMEIENMRIAKSVDLRIMVFPARPLHGRPRNVLHGSYNHDTAQISIYPLKVPRDWIRAEGFSLFKTVPSQLNSSESRTLREIYASALSTLIHEMLHVKFETRGYSRYSEEAIVRKLEKQYVQDWLSGLPSSLFESALPITLTT